METTPVIAVFDVGKTNKKLVLFDEQYKVVYEEAIQLSEISDEDGFPCEDLQSLTQWIQDSFCKIISRQDITIKAINFSAYGASFVHLDENGKPLTSLYNYLKPYPKELQQTFYNTYGGVTILSKQTASPLLGSLNSGLQLYRIKYEQPEIFSRIKCSLHLPQYFSYIISKQFATDITSIGCHTLLWDFEKNKYHDWVIKEELTRKFAPVCPGNSAVTSVYENKNIAIGIGLHDSSAALIPYLLYFHEPFVLLSTGTWCISFNPFNQSFLTNEELRQDCLCYLTYEGKPVKASRLFAGYHHEKAVEKLATLFNKSIDFYKTVNANVNLIFASQKEQENLNAGGGKNILLFSESMFFQRDLASFSSYEEAYHYLMLDIVIQQVASTQLIISDTEVKRIFVDGGFSKNPVYMHLLAAAFPQMEVYAASMAQASAIGAALAIHSSWNTKSLPTDIIDIKLYSVSHQASI